MAPSVVPNAKVVPCRACAWSTRPELRSSNSRICTASSRSNAPPAPLRPCCARCCIAVHRSLFKDNAAPIGSQHKGSDIDLDQGMIRALGPSRRKGDSTAASPSPAPEAGLRSTATAIVPTRPSNCTAVMRCQRFASRDRPAARSRAYETTRHPGRARVSRSSRSATFTVSPSTVCSSITSSPSTPANTSP